MQAKGALYTVFLAVLLLLLQSCAVNKAAYLDHQFSPAQLREDATVLQDVTLAMHPTVGIYHTREHYNRLFADFIGGLNDPLTEKQFRLKLKLLAGGLNCGHTEIIPSRKTYKAMKRVKQNFSPYVFMPVHNRLYVAAALNKRRDTLMRRGTEVVTINGIPVDSMIRHAGRFVSSDGYNQSGPEHIMQWGFNGYYLTLFGRPDTFTVEYREGKNLRRVKYPAVKLNSLPSISLTPKTDSLFTSYRRAGMKYRYLDADKKTMMLKVERFAHNKYRRVYRRIFSRMRRDSAESLVIDLRSNGGGSIANAYRLLGYLLQEPEKQSLWTRVKRYPDKKYTSGNTWFKLTRIAFGLVGTKTSVQDTDRYTYTIKPRKKNHFKGKVIVLINGGSFSASCLVAAYLKSRQRAVFIGGETGGAMEGCNAGITPYYRLPNTGLRARIPAYRVVHDVCPAITGHGILPDHQVEYSIKDILLRKDLELEKTRELLGIK